MKVLDCKFLAFDLVANPATASPNRNATNKTGQKLSVILSFFMRLYFKFTQYYELLSAWKSLLG